MSKNFKVLRDTPFHGKDAVISQSEFNKFYGPGYMLQASTASAEPSNKWFKVMEDEFKIDDIVWHENMKRPMTVVSSLDIGSHPYECTIEAVKSYPNVYKRLATKEEINTYALESYASGRVLANTREVWYFDDPVWTGIKDPVPVLCDIIKAQQVLSSTKVAEHNGASHPVRIGTIKIGCVTLTYEEVQSMARKMNIL